MKGGPGMKKLIIATLYTFALIICAIYLNGYIANGSSLQDAAPLIIAQLICIATTLQSARDYFKN
jgi:hypothetical protein